MRVGRLVWLLPLLALAAYGLWQLANGGGSPPVAVTMPSPASLSAPGAAGGSSPVPASPPPAPQGLQATDGSRAVALSWQPVATATRYVVYRDRLPIARITGSSFTDTTVAKDTPYTYQVAAANRAGTGSPCPPLDVRTYLSWSQIHDLYADSVVHVSTYTSWLGVLGAGVTGTGWFAPGGYIVTNYHVVRSAHYVIDVTLHNALGAGGYTGQRYHASVVAVDPAHDLALLRLDNGWSAAPLPLGNSDTLTVGEPVAILGHPGGEALTLTVGSITALNLTVPVTGYGTLTGMISLNSGAVGGNSGSPVLNHWGEVIGIDESGAPNNGNQAYAVPVNDLTTLGVTIPNPGSSTGG